MTAPVGPTGCEGGSGDRATAWIAGASVGGTSTTLRFEDGSEYRFRQLAATASVGRAFAAGWSVRGSLGAVLGGSVEATSAPGEYEMGAGLVAAVAAARAWSFGPDRRWFAVGSISLAVAAARTREAAGAGDPTGLVGIDARLGVTAGAVVAGVWRPYLLARGFGGPVMWSVDDESVVGSDTRHYQLGLGSTVELGLGLSAVVDAAVLGERAVSVGLGWRR